MRFCPFCAAENPDEASHCSACARKLPAARPSSVMSAAAASSPVDTAAAGDPATSPSTVAVLSAPSVTVTAPAPVSEAASTTPAFPPPPPVPPRADATPTHRVGAPANDGPRELTPFPEPPETGLLGDARYVLALIRARIERRAAILSVDAAMKKDVAALDEVLGDLGSAGRPHKMTARPLTEENMAIDAAQGRAGDADRAAAEAQARLAEEDARFAASLKELESKLAAVEQTSQAASAELEKLEEERRKLRDGKKQVEGKQRQLLKSAEERESKAEKLPMGADRAGLRRSAEELRSDAARLEPERSELEKKLAALEQPLAEAQAHAGAARADLEATRKAQGDARVGHRHRRAEHQAEVARAARARSDAAAEIARRLVTLGTLLNLNRIASPELDPLYASVDELRDSIATREREIERLRAEASRSDPRAFARGTGVLVGALVVFIAVVCLVLSIR